MYFLRQCFDPYFLIFTQFVLCISVLSMVFSTMSVVSSMNGPNITPSNNIKEVNNEVLRTARVRVANDGVLVVTTTPKMVDSKQRLLVQNEAIKLKLPNVVRNMGDSLRNVERANGLLKTAKEEKVDIGRHVKETKEIEDKAHAQKVENEIATTSPVTTTTEMLPVQNERKKIKKGKIELPRTKNVNETEVSF